MKKGVLLEKLLLFERYYKGSKYEAGVMLASSYYEQGLYKLCEKELEKLPSQEQLLKKLIEKLKGKSVYKTLKRLWSGKIDDSVTTLKGLSSLLTHTLIEVEKRNTEYRILVPLIIEKVNELAYNI
ncbi:MAG: hypothetical protein ACTSUO_08475 [Candidatus Thorarchaeota archaeon]